MAAAAVAAVVTTWEAEDTTTIFEVMWEKQGKNEEDEMQGTGKTSPLTAVAGGPGLMLSASESAWSCNRSVGTSTRPWTGL